MRPRQTSRAQPSPLPVSVSYRCRSGLVAGLYEAQRQRLDLNALVKQLGATGRKATGAPCRIATLPRGDHHRGEREAFKS